MDNKKTNDPGGKCVQCVVLLEILKRLNVDVDIPQNCTSAAPIDYRAMKSRKEVIFMLNIDASTYTRWVKQGILVPHIIGLRHFYKDEDLEQALRESVRKGKR